MIQYTRSSYYFNNKYVFEDVPIVVCFCIGLTISEIERVIDLVLASAIFKCFKSVGTGEQLNCKYI